jgi:DNA polymerase-3 subunit gamma/tau
MGKALYRTYRSKKLSEIVGQEHITTALDHALKKGTICHAYLFTGPRGTGKTSIARILAHEINGLPYTEDRQHLDIIEIDAASNRRIDEIRDLRDKVHIAPSSAKYKVYIIDEVHMLTKEAFNALLKTLEEPPEHVVFVLATTEVHKLPETIISRTQRYAFKPVDLPKVVAHLKHIAGQEKIEITDEALGLIAAHGEGSFRDSISLLDQIRNTGVKVDLGAVQAMLGIAPAEVIASMIEQLAAHDSVAVAQGLTHMHEQGYEPAQIARQLGAVLREQILSGASVLPHEATMRLLTQLVQVPASPDPRIALEISLLDTALAPGSNPAIGGSNPSSPAKPTTNTKPAQPPKPDKPESTGKVMSEEVAESPAIQIDTKPEIVKATGSAAAEKKQEAEPADDEPAVAAAPPNVDDELVLNNESWEMVLNAMKSKHNTLYSVAKMAQPHFEPGHITLEFSFAFHQKRINDTRNKETISKIIQSVTGSNMQITCIAGEGRKPEPPKEAPPLLASTDEIVHDVSNRSVSDRPEADKASIDTISNIFGGAELLES